ncbi:hypothetical protein B5X24_HaOG207484 [Helicoverpa armigera]|nr:hypothetical protein B5X24_HaOG207484 [Helicoverpa armigera]
MALLQGPSRKQAELIAQELGEAPGDIERGVRDLRSMLAASPYLPDPENVGKLIQLQPKPFLRYLPEKWGSGNIFFVITCSKTCKIIHSEEFDY